MPLAHSQDRVSIPPDTDLRELAGEIAHEFEENDSVRGVALSRIDDGYEVTATTDESLLSWGEKIRIEITDNEVVIESESPDQWFDWGKSKENVEGVMDLIHKFSDNKGRKYA